MKTNRQLIVDTWKHNRKRSPNNLFGKMIAIQSGINLYLIVYLSLIMRISPFARMFNAMRLLFPKEFNC